MEKTSATNKWQKLHHGCLGGKGFHFFPWKFAATFHVVICRVHLPRLLFLSVFSFYLKLFLPNCGGSCFQFLKMIMWRSWTFKIMSYLTGVYKAFAKATSKYCSSKKITPLFYKVIRLQSLLQTIYKISSD